MGGEQSGRLMIWYHWWSPIALAAALVSSVPLSYAHDPSAWGGLFRSRDDGGAWLPADPGLFVGAALAVAISPTDASHLLYATDTRLLRTRNGGRDWVQEAPEVFVGPTLAVAFDRDGNRAWAATPAGIYRAEAGRWSKSRAPDFATPARWLTAGMAAGSVYLLGARGVYASTDSGASFVRVGQASLPDAPATALAVSPVNGETLLVVVDGRIWSSEDGGKSWLPSDAGLAQGQMQTLIVDAVDPKHLWAASDFQLYRSSDLGKSWEPIGARIGASALSVRGIAVAHAGRVIVLTTHKGLLRSTDSGASWGQVESNLPIHLEAGPLLRDPHDKQTLYAGFALVPYGELRRRAEQGTNLLSQVDPVSLVGAGAFFLLLLIAGTLVARRLARVQRRA